MLRDISPRKYNNIIFSRSLHNSFIIIIMENLIKHRIRPESFTRFLYSSFVHIFTFSHCLHFSKALACIFFILHILRIASGSARSNSYTAPTPFALLLTSELSV